MKYATFPALIHRQVPLDSVITRAWILVSRVGDAFRYELQLTAEHASFGQREDVKASGIAAINFGWRVTPDGGVRVGFVFDTEGNRTELALSPALRTQLTYHQVLRSVRDKLFDTARLAAVGFFKTHLLPEWMTEAVETIAQWRSPSRLAKVACKWVREVVLEERIRELWCAWVEDRITSRGQDKLDLFASQAEIDTWLMTHGVVGETERFALYLEWWRRKNAHLYQWERNQERRALLHRREVYRIWANELASKYREILVDDTDLHQLSRRAKDEDADDASHSGGVRRVASPGLLREIIVQRFGKVRQAYAD
jgi:hypothetical protein